LAFQAGLGSVARHRNHLQHNQPVGHQRKRPAPIRQPAAHMIDAQRDAATLAIFDAFFARPDLV
ncbi:hypothetical protein P3W85_12460, partial [Cupriavidus basilensis]